MANSYSGDPAASAADAVRFQLGDTDTTAGQYNFEDEEVAYALSLYQSNVLIAAAYLARVLATRYADKRDRNIGPLSISYQQQYQRWTETADRLMKMSVTGIDGKGLQLDGSRNLGTAEVLGGGKKYLGPDDTPLTYNEGENEEVED